MPAKKRQSECTSDAVITQMSVGRANRKLAAKQDVSADPDFSALANTLRDLSTIDATRVVALHGRIMGGDYNIQPGRVAEKLLNLESTLDPS